MNIVEYLENVKRIRQRLRNPPNAVHDPGIDLTRKSTAYKGDIIPLDTPPKKKLDEPGVGPIIIFPVNFEDILEAVAQHYHLSVERLRGDRRFKLEVLARRVVVHLGLKMLGRSLTSIARDLNKDHTSIIYARDKVKIMLQMDSQFRGEVNSIEESIIGDHHNRPPLPSLRQFRLEGSQRSGHPIQGIPVLVG